MSNKDYEYSPEGQAIHLIFLISPIVLFLFALARSTRLETEFVSSPLFIFLLSFIMYYKLTAHMHTLARFVSALALTTSCVAWFSFCRTSSVSIAILFFLNVALVYWMDEKHSIFYLPFRKNKFSITLFFMLLSYGLPIFFNRWDFSAIFSICIFVPIIDMMLSTMEGPHIINPKVVYW